MRSEKEIDAAKIYHRKIMKRKALSYFCYIKFILTVLEK